MMYDKNDHLAELSDLEHLRGTAQSLPSPLNEPFRADACACREILSSSCTVDEAVEGLSISEAIAVALAFGRADLLPEPYDDFRTAWRRLDHRQRRLVDLAARARWKGRGEGATC
ncbi:hypothetical protein [Rubellimicrobium arenae]|uniref:hypothetical protein n=1 Tax=Rubellimicrobium arenae TaxID=2817372 RepID=UPI001B309218|nr:hypothetical protein [Rubellimicrobium arenae]